MEYPTLSREDYEEPRCPLCSSEEITSIPVNRVIEKLDEYLNQNDYPAAEKHLQYWLAEAEASRDQRGKLSVLNEQIGLYRKLERETEALQAADAALTLAKELGMENTITMGTTLVNAATAYKAFGRATEALPLYRQAEDIYMENLPADDPRLAGLYNNMAVTVVELGNFLDAEEFYAQAMDIMAKQEHGEAELAITWCNMADLAAKELGLDEGEARIGECLEKALALLDTPGLPRNGYYAFVCEKCAPTFGYYGWFAVEEDLRNRAKEIYERV